MSSSGEPAGAETRITHPVDFETCYVTQRGRSVAVVKKGELDAQEMFAPPQAWGERSNHHGVEVRPPQRNGSVVFG